MKHIKQTICDECHRSNIFIYRSDISKTTSPLVFLLGEDKVIKFFANKKERKRELKGLTRTECCVSFLTPKLLAGGDAKIDRHKLTYLICSRVPGICYQELVLEKKFLILDDMLNLAKAMGIAVRELHNTKSLEDPAIELKWAKWNKILVKRRSKLEKKKFFLTRMSTEARNEMLGTEFWPPNFLNFVKWGDSPVFLHGDLNNENVMLRKEKEKHRFGFAGIVDFGDSHFGHRIYEFVAIHLSVFFCDKDLLKVFLEAYGFDQLPSDSADFAHQCLVYMLLNDSPAIKFAARCCPQITQCQTLKEMGEILFDIDSRQTGVWGIEDSIKAAEKKQNK